MTTEQMEEQAVGLVAQAVKAGYRLAMTECLSHLIVLANVIPESVTKAWLIEQVRAEAMRCKKLAEGV